MPLFLLFLLLLLLSPATTKSTTNTQSEEEAAAQIHHFQQYLRIQTAHPNPDYAAAISFLSSQALSIGLQTSTLEFSPQKPLLLLSWPGSNPSLPSLLLNSHIDSVPADPTLWAHPPFSAHRDSLGRIFARGAQDDKSIAIQYLEAIRALKSRGFRPLRSVHVSFVPDEEIGGADGNEKFVASEEFGRLNVGFVLDEGQASVTDEFRVFYADRLPWSLVVRAVGPPGHGSRMYEGSAAENVGECLEAVAQFREGQFGLVRDGGREASEVVSVNAVYLKAGTATPTVS